MKLTLNSTISKNIILRSLLIALLVTSLTCKNDSSTGPEEEQNNSVWAQAWLTTGDERNKLTQQDSLEFTADFSTNTTRIELNEELKYQEMDGFGAALTNSSAWVMFNSSQRDEVLTKLFSVTDGIGISYIRLPMGASDFTSQPAYTYNDLPPGQIDMNLESFSIDPDRAFILPVLKQAISLQPELKIMASPWSAPAWMKSPATLNGGTLQQIFYQPYANYFVKFIQAYSGEGIAIDAITIQNEPEHNTNDYPSMRMQAFEQANFIKNNLGPVFQDNELNTKILIWDHNWDRPEYALAVLDDATANPYITGSAWHCYGGSVEAQNQVYNAYPDKDVYFTECSGGEWDSNFGSVLVWNMRNLFIGSVRNWAKTVLLWNLALNENHGPHEGGCGNCRGLVTISSGNNVTYEVEYYITGHLSKFVQPGAIRIESTYLENQVETVAFLNPNDSKVLVALNPGSTSRTFDVNWSNQRFSYNLPGRSVVTFHW